MEQNKSIVERIATAFLERLHEQPATKSTASKFAELLTENQKPKASDFVAFFESQVTEPQISEGSTTE